MLPEIRHEVGQEKMWGGGVVQEHSKKKRIYNLKWYIITFYFYIKWYVADTWM